MKRPFDAAVEEMHKIKPAAVGLIGIDCYYLMAALLKPFPGFANLNAISTTPFAGRSVIDQEDSHGSQCLTDCLGGDGNAGVTGFVTRAVGPLAPGSSLPS